MRLNNRLRRLERQNKQGGPCPVCRDRAARVPVATCRMFLPDNGRDEALVPNEASCRAPDPSLCHACGWRPAVFEVGEVVVEGRGVPDGGPRNPDRGTEGELCD